MSQATARLWSSAQVRFARCGAEGRPTSVSALSAGREGSPSCFQVKAFSQNL